MATAKRGDTVTVHYTGRLRDGTVFDSTLEREPMRLTIGAGQAVQGFEEALVGMQPGQKKNVILPADKAFGRRQKYMLRVLSRTALPEQAEIRVGQRLRLNQQDGSTAIVTVTRVGKSEVTVDGNHPLAGQDVAFEIQLVTIN